MDAFWIVVSFIFTFGVLGIVGYALFRVATAGRRHDAAIHRHG